MIPLEDIRSAQETLAGTAIRTPLVRLHAGDGAEIYLKLENLQPIGSFKIRGAYNAARRASPDELTVFRSLGLAVEDLAAAEYVVRRARETGTGTEVDF